jgi:hypothetical protein
LQLDVKSFANAHCIPLEHGKVTMASVLIRKCRMKVISWHIFTTQGVLQGFFWPEKSLGSCKAEKPLKNPYWLQICAR